MESANLRTQSAYKQELPKRNWGALLTAATLVVLMLLLSRGDLRWSHRALIVTSVLGVVLFGVLWQLHLKSVDQGWRWLFPLPALLAGQLALLVLRTRPDSTGDWVGALGVGIFVYLMLWTFAAYEQEGSLQPLATGALLLSAGILAKPAVGLSCTMLSSSFFLVRSRRHAAGTIGFALLMFTPAALCVVSLALLSTAGGRAFGSHLGELALFHPHAAGVSRAADPALSVCLRSGVAFALAATVTRVAEATAGSVDKAYGLLLLLVITAGRAQWMPVPLNTADIAMVAYGGGAMLVALSPPRAWLGRLLLSLAACVPLSSLLTWHS